MLELNYSSAVAKILQFLTMLRNNFLKPSNHNQVTALEVNKYNHHYKAEYFTTFFVLHIYLHLLNC